MKPLKVSFTQLYEHVQLASSNTGFIKENKLLIKASRREKYVILTPVSGRPGGPYEIVSD